MGEIVRCEMCEQTFDTREGKVLRFTHRNTEPWWACIACLGAFYFRIISQRLDHFHNKCNPEECGL